MQDTWHTSGNSNYHTRPENKELIDLLKEKYRKREELVPVEPTGYPAVSLDPGRILQNAPSWGEDGLGRFFFFTGKPEMPIFFQRYTQGQVLVGYRKSNGYHGWESMSRDAITSIFPLTSA